THVEAAGFLYRCRPAAVRAQVWAGITEFDLPHPNSGPGTIIVGPDGNLWFTEHSDPPRINGNRIGRFNLADSAFTEFELPNPNSDPTGLTISPDNNLWFTEYYGKRCSSAKHFAISAA